MPSPSRFARGTDITNNQVRVCVGVGVQMDDQPAP